MIFELSTEFMKRYRKFLSSKEYRDIDSHSKSDYWKHHSDAVDISISGNTVTVGGESGFYIPSNKNLLKNSRDKILKLIENPSKLIPYIKRKIGISESEIKLLSYFEAFEKVMNQDTLADPDLSSFRINFLNLKEKPGIESSIENIQNNYFAKDKYNVSPHIVRTYYFFNILHAYLDITRTKTILEIGAGNGNLLSFLYSFSNDTTIIDVDLPETLSHAILYISDLFPKAKLLLPNETESVLHGFDNYDFVFLIPKQSHLIKNDSIDLAINIASFQEMTHRQIEEYFELIQRCAKNESHFFTYNRVEKIPCGPDSFKKETSEPPNRFSEYPWNSKTNKTLIYEICRLTRLVQLDNAYIRLEQIKK
jgi:putative sugar O-methyltransferase